MSSKAVASTLRSVASRASRTMILPSRQLGAGHTIRSAPVQMVPLPPQREQMPFLLMWGFPPR